MHSSVASVTRAHINHTNKCASDLLRNLIRESTPLKDKDTERDKTVIKPRAGETISRPSSRGKKRGDVTMEG